MVLAFVSSFPFFFSLSFLLHALPFNSFAHRPLFRSRKCMIWCSIIALSIIFLLRIASSYQKQIFVCPCNQRTFRIFYMVLVFSAVPEQSFWFPLTWSICIDIDTTDAASDHSLISLFSLITIPLFSGPISQFCCPL
jgi:hypothetical protein